jgi:hypothetical protein
MKKSFKLLPLSVLTLLMFFGSCRDEQTMDHNQPMEKGASMKQSGSSYSLDKNFTSNNIDLLETLHYDILKLYFSYPDFPKINTTLELTQFTTVSIHQLTQENYTYKNKEFSNNMENILSLSQLEQEIKIKEKLSFNGGLLFEKINTNFINQSIDYEEIGNTITKNTLINTKEKTALLAYIGILRTSSEFWLSFPEIAFQNNGLNSATPRECLEQLAECVGVNFYQIVLADGYAAIFSILSGNDIITVIVETVLGSLNASLGCIKEFMACLGLPDPLPCTECPEEAFSFDGANCYFGTPFAGEAFVYGNNHPGFYHSPNDITQCFPPYTTYDNANCFYMSVPEPNKYQPFIYNNSWYTTTYCN